MASSTNSIKRFTPRSGAPPEGMSLSTSTCVSVCEFSLCVLVDMEEKRELEKDQTPTPHGSQESRSLTLQYNAPNVTAPVST